MQARQTHLTPSELERIAYISGDTVRANVLALLDDAQLSIDGLEDQVCGLEDQVCGLEDQVCGLESQLMEGGE